ncbi:MAG: rhodanese-like domain-containing protein [Smithellaceae bacterium]|jgi:rhodanese-related sulfurtransferase|nr:rhodanese-like domain-containing protein [Smithellaceae bacterium]MDD3259893.1 rhodanese-like domain-containing protein [Smithellaceae bacterium]MDD3849046.1 rhodanese-like domain-containing protein [Smithellaceae bacterium]HOG12417.1 rhodanese-like domain-containing protein [Smithellaceae bacterium]HOQ71595.1 rhodanese-like domain-containing protein [Smithellaceae bacterium]
MEQEDLIVDVRTREEFLKEHVKGAINIPLYDVSFYTGILRGRKIRAYCNTGHRAALALEKMKALGVDAAMIEPKDLDKMEKERVNILCAVNFVSARPGGEEKFLQEMIGICRATEGMDGYLGSKVLEVSGVSAAGSFLSESCGDLEIIPCKYIILTYWTSKEAHEKSHQIPEFLDRYAAIPAHLTQVPYEEFYEILK